MTTDGPDWAVHFEASWPANADRLEAQLAPLDDLLLPAASLRGGDQVLDVGCGRGPTARRAALDVGASGSVTGIDLAPSLIEAARQLGPASAAVADLRWVHGDAQTHDLGDGVFDVVVSRFGTLFFADPVAGFANIGRAVRPGGRLTVLVWQPRDASPFQTVAVDAAHAVLREAGHDRPVGPSDEGPYAFGVPAFMLGVLAEAGWVDAEFTPHVVPVHVGGPGCSPGEATELGLAVGGPLRFLLEGVSPATVDAVRTAVTTALGEHWDGVGVRLDAAVAVVTARRAVHEQGR